MRPARESFAFWGGCSRLFAIVIFLGFLPFGRIHTVMKKRFQCMFLTFVLLLTCFCVSCGDKEDIDTVTLNNGTSKAPAMTITIWGIKGDNTTDEAVALVEEAMSAITQSEYNTAVKLNLYTEDEYIEALEARMSEIAEQKELEEAAAEQEEALKMLEGADDDGDETEEAAPSEDVTSINELGLVEIVYPEPDPDQLDIFFIPDYKTYVEYADADYLSILDTELDTTGKRMKTFIHPNILGASKLNGITYSIINNKPVGEYTYLLLNKALLDKYYYDADEITQFSMADEFIMDVGANEPGITPVLGDFDPIGVQYFTADGSYVDHYRQIKKYESLGYVGDGTADVGKFAVGVVRGNAADAAKYEDSYVVTVLQKPYVDNSIYNNMFANMFAISSYTKDLTRSMEVLTAINTNSELRNIFGYGVEGVHYKLDADGVVVRLNNDYDTPLEYTGNMFITYPPEGTYPEVWEDCKAQNLEIVDSPFFGFMTEDVVDGELYNQIAEISKSYFAEFDRLTFAQYDAWIEKANAELKANEAVTMYTSFTESKGLAYQYNEWFFSLFPDALAL